MRIENSYEVAVFCNGRDDAKAGIASCADDYLERDREVYQEGYKAGRMARLRRLGFRHLAPSNTFASVARAA